MFPLAALVLFTLWGAFTVAFQLLATRRWAVRATRTLGLPEPAAGAVFIGEYADLVYRRRGMRRSAQLDLFDWGVRLRGLESRWLDPVWEVRYRELGYAQPIRSLLLPVTGVLLSPVTGVARPMIFWTGQRDDILARLREHGVKVHRAVLTLESVALPARLGL